MRREHRLPSERVVSDLLRRLHENEWEPGQALPSVTELAQEYRVARATISRVIKVLADAGEVTTRERWGVFRSAKSQSEGTQDGPNSSSLARLDPDGSGHENSA